MVSSSSGLKRAWTRFLNCTETLAHSSFDVLNISLRLGCPTRSEEKLACKGFRSSQQPSIAGVTLTIVRA
jgi:hypothetical protein